MCSAFTLRFFIPDLKPKGVREGGKGHDPNRPEASEAQSSTRCKMIMMSTNKYNVCLLVDNIYIQHVVQLILEMFDLLVLCTVLIAGLTFHRSMLLQVRSRRLKFCVSLSTRLSHTCFVTKTKQPTADIPISHKTGQSL